ncbi:hypothetical protein CRENBAI_011025, partial [Crenichthys baileyi]
MLPARLHSGVLHYTNPDRMLLPTVVLADERQASSMDLFTFLSRESEKTLRRSAGLSVPQSATAPSPRLAAALPMASSLAPAQVSAVTPGELEERLRFFARQIKSFRRISLLHSSPELKAKVREMGEDYKAAVRQFYCSLPPSSPGPRAMLLQLGPCQVSTALLLRSSPRQVSRALLLPSSPCQVPRAPLLLPSSPRQVSRAPLLHLAPRQVSRGLLLPSSPRGP